MFSFDYISEIAEGAISKLPWYYQILILLIAAIACILICYIYNDKIIAWVKKHSKCLVIILVILILCLVAVSTVDYFYSPKPPADHLVVAISPFHYIDEYGQFGYDINIADDFKEKLEAETDLGIKVIMLDNSIRDSEDAKTQGKKIGAHLVVYGEIKKKMAGSVGEVKYYILPLSSLEIIPPVMPFLEGGTEDRNGLIITEKATFSMVTEEPIIIVESLTQNASSSIYAIGAFEKYKKSDFASAINFFRYTKNYENNSLILSYIANCYHFNKNLNESLQYFDKAIEINPQFAEAWYNKAIVLGEVGRYEEAITAYDTAFSINPQIEHAEAWCNKGTAFLHLGRYEEAITAYNTALSINPNLENAGVWTNIGVTLFNLGMYEGAIAAYGRAIKINPQFAEAWCNKATALGHLDQYEEAIEAYDKAFSINPQLESAEAWYNIGTALCKVDRCEESIEAYDKAMEMDPQTEHVGAWYNKGLAFDNLGRYDDAIAAYERAIKIDPQFAEAWCNKATALGHLDRYDEAIEAYD
jgi:tetratricopeptide (TPR) repeat protein